MNDTVKQIFRQKSLLIGLVATLGLSACTIPGGISVSNPLIPKAEDSTTGGIVDHGMYKAVVAGQGDTMQTLAARAGVTAEQLASHNGVPVDYQPKNGQEFAIPGGAALKPEPVVETKELPKEEIETSSLGNKDSGTTTHRVKAGETAYSIARLYGVSVTSLSSWNKLGPELEVTEGQELIIPTSETPDSKPTETEVAKVETSTTTDASSSSGFQKPVAGSISTGYDPSNNSDGVIYSTSSQATVKATAAGKVVLISESTGANGTIVMVQHSNGLISVYGKLGKVSVTKGQQVSAGQTIGTTAGSQLLFQLRKGTASVDPGKYV